MPFMALFLASVLLGGQNQPLPSGTICGDVENENGAPASSVMVSALYLGPHSGIQPSSKTDSTGHYCIRDGLYPGEYTLSASDPDKQYPNMGSMFYAVHLPGPRIELKPGAIESHGDFRIPYKAGSISIQLTDARTGKALSSMLYNLDVKSNPEQRYIHGSSDSTMPLLVPPNEDIYLTVTSPGYGTWPEDGTRGRIINLLPGSTVKLKIALQPKQP